ncbi:MAG: hypothetical protein WAX77_16455 [Methylococcaceae bacterium]
MSTVICAECGKENEPHENVCVRCFSVLKTQQALLMTSEKPLISHTDLQLTALKEQLEAMNSRFDFLEALFEEITELGGINFVADLEVFVLQMQFFQHNESQSKEYSNKFAKAYTAIAWEIVCVYRLTTDKSIAITQLYKNTEGVAIYSAVDTISIPANQTHYAITNSYVDDWQRGRYSVELFVDNHKLAQGYFEIY